MVAYFAFVAFLVIFKFQETIPTHGVNGDNAINDEGNIHNLRQFDEWKKDIENGLKRLEDELRQMKSRLANCPCFTGSSPPPTDTGTELDECPYLWSNFNQSCWKHFDEAHNWTEAQNLCQSAGGNLASINSQSENDFALTVIGTIKNVTINPARKDIKIGTWIGLEDQKTEKEYYWVDSSSLSFFNWAVNQPDDNGHIDNCVIINENPPGTWSDVSCSSLNPFLCKMHSKKDHDIQGNIDNPRALYDLRHLPTVARLVHLLFAIDRWQKPFKGKISNPPITYGPTQKNLVTTMPYIGTTIPYTEPQETGSPRTPEEASTAPRETITLEPRTPTGKNVHPEVTSPLSELINHNNTHTCPPGWARFNQTCWQHFDLPLNWTSARNHCLVSGGDLASIHGEKENEFACTMGLKNNEPLTTSAPVNTVTRQCKSNYQDILLLVDGSGSIGTSEFPKIKSFLKLLVDTVDVGINKTQFGLVQFSDKMHTEFTLNAHHTSKEVKDAIDKVRYREGGTFIAEAIKYVIHNELQPSDHGRRSGYPLLVIILTDGVSEDDPTQNAEYLREFGATVITIGVTQAINKSQLINIAGNDNRVFVVQDFSSLDKNLTDLINNQICSEVGSWLGLQDQHQENVFKWSDGSESEFFNWKDGQPDDKEHGDNCVILNESPVGTWSDVSCLSLKPFLCKAPMRPSHEIHGNIDATPELNKNTPAIVNTPPQESNTPSQSNGLSELTNSPPETSTSPLLTTIPQGTTGPPQVTTSEPETSGIPVVTNVPPVTGKPTRIINGSPPVSQNETQKHKCPMGWVHFNQSCWQLFDQPPLNWSQAQDHCRSIDSKLVSIHSKEENDFVSTIIYKNKTAAEVVGKESEKCFVKFPQKMLVGPVETTHLAVTLEKCKSICMNALINCSSFIFYSGPSRCTISRQSRLTQSDFFLDVIGNEKVDYYDKVPCNFDSTRQCNPVYKDIMLIVDGSGSIGTKEFPKIKEFLKLLVNRSDIGPTKNQFGMIQFSDKIWSEFHLKTYHSNHEVKGAIDKVKYREGGTLTGKAIEFVINEELQPMNGRRPDYGLQAIIVTDGASQDDPSYQAERLRDMGATVITIGVTNEINKTQLIDIAGSEHRVFIVKDFSSLNKNLTDLINNQICSEKGTWIGLSDQFEEKFYQWDDHTEPLYFNWASAQPQDTDHVDNCVIINDIPIGTWSDINCLSLKPYLCKKPASTD